MTCLRAAVTAAVVIAGMTLADGEPAAAQSGEPTEFLQQLTGEWSVVSEAIPGPGQDPVRLESREVARLLGGQWLVAEGSGTTPTGQPHTSILTLGYDPPGSRFVGTYISSLQTHLWSYTGTLDDSGTTLTLETEGPILGDPDRITKYREVIEIIDVDHRITRSMILGPDGEWFEFARAEYRRTD